jgi:hypothetical protein
MVRQKETETAILLSPFRFMIVIVFANLCREFLIAVSVYAPNVQREQNMSFISKRDCDLIFAISFEEVSYQAISNRDCDLIFAISFQKVSYLGCDFSAIILPKIFFYFISVPGLLSIQTRTHEY